MKLYYQSQGEGPPLIIIHGLFGSSDNWRSMAKFFARHYQVFSVDLRNHGRSPHSETQTFANMAEDIYALCQQQRLDNVHVIGHSLGGKVAMQLAESYPQLINKLVIVDIAPRQYFSQHTPLMDAMMALDLRQFNQRAEVDAALTKAIPDKTVRQFLLMNLVSDNETLEWRINLPALKQNYQQLMAAVCLNAQLTMPALFVYGEQSDYVNADDRQQIADIFSQAKFVGIIGAGHWVQAEKPQQFKKVVEEFLRHD